MGSAITRVSPFIILAGGLPGMLGGVATLWDNYDILVNMVLGPLVQMLFGLEEDSPCN